jgi:hypothetical protein
VKLTWCLPGAISAMVKIPSAMLAAVFANMEHCVGLSPGRRKQIFASYVTQLSPHLPRYVLVKIIVWFIIINLRPSPDKLLCICTISLLSSIFKSCDLDACDFHCLNPINFSYIGKTLVNCTWSESGNVESNTERDQILHALPFPSSFFVLWNG